MEERSIFIIPIGEKKTIKEQLELIKKYKSQFSISDEIPDEDFNVTL